MRIRSFLEATVLTLAVVLPAAAAAPEAKAADGPRRDPKGIKGISPFWESLKKGDDAMVARNHDGAIAGYKEALGHEPQHPMGHYRLGEAQLAKGDPKEARASWESAKRYSGNDMALRAKVLFVLADLDERERNLDMASNDWAAYASHAQAQPEVKSYPETPVDRKKRIDTWKQLEVDYAAVKERIKKRLEEATKPKS